MNDEQNEQLSRQIGESKKLIKEITSRLNKAKSTPDNETNTETTMPAKAAPDEPGQSRQSPSPDKTGETHQC
jgi:hypothetical protein